MIKDLEQFLQSILKHTKFKDCSFIVGGYNRDILLNKPPKDLDLVVELKDGSKQLAEFLYINFPNKITYPIKMGNYPIYQITFLEDINGYSIKGEVVEIAETMKEEFTDKSSRQRNVVFASLKEDILRRDFTCNSIVKNVVSGEFIDIIGGINDIHNKVLRCNSEVDPEVIFSQDPLRILRMCIFSIKLGFEIDNKTFHAAKKVVNRLDIISKERIHSEIWKLDGIEKGIFNLVVLLDKLNALKNIFPEVHKLKFIEQQPDERNIHLEGMTVFDHTLEVLSHSKSSMLAQMACLLHDIGKAYTQKFVDGKVQFLHHEIEGADLASDLLFNLKFSSDFIDDVVFLIRNHMKPCHIAEGTDKAKRRLLCECGNLFPDLIDLVEADSKGTLCMIDGKLQHCKCDHIRQSILNVKPLENQPKIDQILNGNEIMELLNIKPCKKVGEVKEFIQDLQDEFAENLTKEFVIERVKEQFLN